MLNYIWAGLIVFSLVFALVGDVGDIARDTYRNEQALPVELAFPDGAYAPEARRQPVELRIDPAAYGAFYGTDARPDSAYSATLIRNDEGLQVRVDEGVELPEPLATIATATNTDTGQLQGLFLPGGPGGAPGGAAGAVRFEPVRFVKMNAISAAAIDFAETAAEIALGLIGVLALFLGLLKIAEEAGVVHALVKVVRPVLRPLFPDVPPDHPALGMIALNLAANIFGLGNAATPFGIKAMEEMQRLNPTDDTATDPMVMLLAMNTASVQLVPPVLLIALMGLQINELIFAIWITTGLSLTIAIVAVKVLGRMKGYRASNPNRLDAPPPAAPPAPLA